MTDATETLKMIIRESYPEKDIQVNVFSQDLWDKMNSMEYFTAVATAQVKKVDLPFDFISFAYADKKIHLFKTINPLSKVGYEILDTAAKKKLLEILSNWKNATENNKYYIPAIEEFHVGFEYMEDVTQGQGGENQKTSYWMKQKYANDSFNCTNVYDEVEVNIINDFNSRVSLLTVKEKIEKGFIKVKYLDHDDIIECGWNFVEGYSDIYEDKNRLTLKLGPIICIARSLLEDDGLEKTIFYGKIRNKSELQRIMKQVGI